VKLLATSKIQKSVSLVADKSLRLLLVLLLLSVATVAQGQLLRFSTLYGSLSGNAPLVENSKYRVNGVAGSGYLEEITEVNKPNYILTVGLRTVFDTLATGLHSGVAISAMASST
jgi:hypothetical protein